jgi:chromosome segregation ATPase
MKNLQEKIASMNKQMEIKQLEADNATKEAQAEKAEVERFKSEILMISENNTQEAQQIQQKIESTKRRHESEMATMKEKYDQLEAKLTEYHHKLFLAVRNM